MEDNDTRGFNSRARCHCRSGHCLGVHDLHRFKCDTETSGKQSGTLVNLNPDQPDDFIVLFMPYSETN